MKPLVLLLLIATALASPLAAQDTTRATADSSLQTTTHLYRNPRLARILGSVIPGAGHIYAGEYWRGVVNYEGVVATIGMGAMGFAVSGLCPGWTPCSPAHQILVDVMSGAIVGVGVWRWMSTARDAAHAAERANVKHSRKAATLKPIIGAPVGTHGDWNLGVEIPW